MRIMIDLVENANGEYIRLKDISGKTGNYIKNMETDYADAGQKAGYVRSYRGNNGVAICLCEKSRKNIQPEILSAQRKGSLAPIACLDDVLGIAARVGISVPHLSSGKD